MSALYIDGRRFDNRHLDRRGRVVDEIAGVVSRGEIVT
jgi:hypothetical protein